MKYNVVVEEVLSRVITVEAPTAEQARARVQEEYDDETIVLDFNDLENSAEITVQDDEVPDDFEPDFIVPEVGSLEELKQSVQ